MVWLINAVDVRSARLKPSCRNDTSGLGRAPACISAPADASTSARAPRSAGLFRAATASASESVNDDAGSVSDGGAPIGVALLAAAAPGPGVSNGCA